MGLMKNFTWKWLNTALKLVASFSFNLSKPWQYEPYDILYRVYRGGYCQNKINECRLTFTREIRRHSCFALFGCCGLSAAQFVKRYMERICELDSRWHFAFVFSLDVLYGSYGNVCKCWQLRNWKPLLQSDCTKIHLFFLLNVSATTSFTSPAAIKMQPIIVRIPGII